MLNRPDLYIDVVVGRINPHKEQVEQLCRSMQRTTFYSQVDNIAELMAQADLAIGAGGATTWERCFLGLPSLIVVIAENQREVAKSVHELGLGFCIGDLFDNTTERIAVSLE